MSFYSVHESYYAPLGHGAPQISTFLMCGSSLLRAGVKHILSGTCFVVQEGTSEDDPGLSCFSAAESLLFIIQAKTSSEMAELIRGLKAQCEQARIVVLADDFDVDLIFEAYNAGADGCLKTTSGRDALIKSLELIVLGERVFPAAAVLSLIHNAPSKLEQEDQQEAAKMLMNTHLPEGKVLSNREQAILRLLTEGASNKMIARKLCMAEATVKVHLKSILRKIGLRNRTQAAMWAATHLHQASAEAVIEATPEAGQAGVRGNQHEAGPLL